MKSLFNEYNAFTHEAIAISDTTNEFCKSLFAQGYNPREVSHIICSTVQCFESEQVLSAAMKLREEKRNEKAAK